MAAYVAMKNLNNRSQKDDGGAPSVGIAAMEVAMVPKKQNDKFK